MKRSKLEKLESEREADPDVNDTHQKKRDVKAMSKREIMIEQAVEKEKQR